MATCSQSSEQLESTLVEESVLLYADVMPTDGRLREDQWAPSHFCIVGDALHYGMHCMSLREIVAVSAPVELGAFVFQVHHNGGTVITFRAKSFLQMTTCCEGLCRFDAKMVVQFGLARR